MGGASARIQGDEKVLADLFAMRQRIQHLEPAFTEIGVAFRRHEAATFDSEGASVGHPWQALSPRYAAYKLRKVGPKPILQFTHEMYASFTVLGAPGNVQEIGPQFAVYGSSIRRGVYHQSRLPRTRLPRRPMLVVTPELQAAANSIVKRWVLDGVI